MSIHKFEAAGLGKAPFFYRGFVQIPSTEVAEKNPSGYENMMKDIPPAFHCGTCAYCGLAIMNNYLVASSDEKFFSVGMDCIKKIDDIQILKKASTEERFRKKLKLQIQIDEGFKLIEEHRNLLELEPHPHFEGKTLWDYAEWMMENAGQPGKHRMLKLCMSKINGLKNNGGLNEV